MPPVNLYMRLQLAPALAAVSKLLGQVPRPARRAGPGRGSPRKLGAGPLGQTRANRCHIDGALLKEGLNPFLRLGRAGMERAPQALGETRDGSVELLAGDDLVD